MKSNNKYAAVLYADLKNSQIAYKYKELFESELKQVFGEDIKELDYLCTCCETSLCGDIKSLCNLCSDYYDENNDLDAFSNSEIHIIFEKTEKLSTLGRIVIDTDNKLIKSVFVEKL